MSIEENLDWQFLKPEILGAITDHYMRGMPLFTEELESEDTKINDDDTEAV